ncbi:xylulokinase [Burkholderia pseudomultivorans]|uniref:Xylulose kinase n=1 Tax=Burkholderia pseudomultivorans TaxID=1207504 RepID=A0ABU2DVP6_9BURK|nr:FGGY-family carbohydrate kinase [Burkholderia pseudomultivorans]MDR8730124.1 Xylulose kinase [Burkholderia pseudomultivorans]MDR8734709.1 Xylulose kinase [Burkholderia pseudomultivorans]MDR8740675.1 Xylulose kinase [Burkholderia pseudomultivorans]MDR8751660.1 Xylulose kinase [Burkholderia pseudomultivorans]MDR8777089.1 Xylulose kinase [Burkholderia pseudomultivorans]
MKKHRYVLSVDLGTSGPKAVLVSESGRVAGAGRAYVNTLAVGDRGAEQVPDAIWAAVKDAVGSAVSGANVEADEIVAMICSSQYSSIVPVDASGQALANMILWTDGRGTKARLAAEYRGARKLDKPWQLANWLRLHGLAPLMSGMSLNHMRYFRFACPEIYERTYRFLEPMDYLGMKLSGRMCTTQGSTLMSLTVDNRRLTAGEYHPTLLRYAHVDREKLPELVPTTTVLGHLLPDVAAELGLSTSTRVVVGLSDTAAGAMGGMAFTGGHAGICIGTSGVMVTHTESMKTSVRDSLFTMPSPDERKYLAIAENGMSGAALDRFLRNIVFPNDAFAEFREKRPAELYAALDAVLDNVDAGAGGLIFLPWLGGTMAPKASSDMRGGFINMNGQTTRSHMARAVLEGLAFNLRWVRKPLEEFVGRRFTHFNFYGGGANSAFMAQTLADVMGSPIHQMANPQYVNSIGAAMLAFERIGEIGIADFSRNLSIRAEFEPTSALKDVYDDMFDTFESAFDATRRLYRKIRSANGHEAHH